MSAVEVFDGPPAEMASLEPGDGGWTLNYKAAAPDGHFYLGCYYATRTTPLAIRLPPTVSNCRITQYPQVSCH
ncbi:STY0301 family protein [Lichenicola sp.]|uniref:STY0301 family protein n=1 Tax=Lichenicola sp. TaxID=2804529 RepID=UPI003B008A26